MHTLKVFIADNHPVIREGLTLLLGSKSRFLVVGTADNGKDAVEETLNLNAQVVVMDIRMPKLNGIEAAHQIKAIKPNVGIVIFSNHGDVEYAQSLLSDGSLGYGYLLKTASIADLEDAILQVAVGAYYIKIPFVERNPFVLHLQPLTPQEKNVLRKLAQGLNNKKIGEDLSLQSGTISMYINNIYSKLSINDMPDANNRVAATLMWHGIDIKSLPKNVKLNES